VNGKVEELQYTLLAINGVLERRSLSKSSKTQLELLKAEVEAELRVALDQEPGVRRSDRCED
jgi:hypothetical protein